MITTGAETLRVRNDIFGRIMIYSVEFTKDDRTWFEAAELFDLDEAEFLLDKFPAEHRGWDFIASRIVGHLGNSNKIIKYSKLNYVTAREKYCRVP